jgi:hypothetical protein
MPVSSLLEQARRQAKGQSAERNDWNEVTVGQWNIPMLKSSLISHLVTLFLVVHIFSITSQTHDRERKPDQCVQVKHEASDHSLQLPLDHT